MNKKLIKIALVGKTNAGKSTLINSLVGEKISIINKKINTTQESILGIKNIDNIQIVFFDTPGSNFLKTTNIMQKKLKINLWNSIDEVDLIVYLVDVKKYDFNIIQKDILKISEVNKPIIFVFNKIDLIDNKIILPYIKELKNISLIEAFFLISAKLEDGISSFIKYFLDKSYLANWLYDNNEITNKDDIFISNECTRNAILDFLHQEIPYNLNVKNTLFKYLKKDELKIKQYIEIENIRYKSIILGNKGVNIKRIREKSQIEIKNIFNCKVHLYLQVVMKNEK